MATNAPPGGPGFNTAYYQDPSLFGDQQALMQQQLMASLLKERGMADNGGITMAGRVAIPNSSPMQSIAQMAQLLSGQNLQGSVNQGNAALMQRTMAANLRNVNGSGDGQQPLFQRIPGDRTGAATAGVLGTDINEYGKLLSGGQTDLTKTMQALDVDPNSAGGRELLAHSLFNQTKTPLDDLKTGTTAIDRYYDKGYFGSSVPHGMQPDKVSGDGRINSASWIPGVTQGMTDAASADAAGKSMHDMVEFTHADGKKQNMTRAQAVQWVNGANNTPTFNVAPGTDMNSYRAALDKADPTGAASAAFDAQRNAIPGRTTGQSTADKEAQGVGAKAIIDRNQQIIGDANSARQDIQALDKMDALFKSGHFGPGASNVAKWKAMAAQIPGAGSIIDTSKLESQQTAVTEMKKLFSGMAGRISGASGTGTDARLQNAIDQLPNDATPEAAAKVILPMLRGQRQARLDEAGMRARLGNNPDAIQKFETQYQSINAPLAYEYTQATRGMTDAQKQAYIAQNYTPVQAGDIAQARTALRGMGVKF